MEDLVSFTLCGVGLTIVIVWPASGPGAWIRERVLRPLLPKSAHGLLDCYVCFSFWAGAVLSTYWNHACHALWTPLGCLMLPAVFWTLLVAAPQLGDRDTDATVPRKDEHR